jgi:hypothetical protein
MAKRRRIQSRRKRADSEIFPLFKSPFYPLGTGDDYSAVYESTIRHLGVVDHFQRLAKERDREHS